MMADGGRHLHLDPLGGIAGDMLIAALLDAFPEHAGAVIAAAALLAPVTAELRRHDDGVLAGSRFVVTEHTSHAHGHTPWRDIRNRLEAAALAPGVRHHAVGIFTCLAEAEGRVHGIEPDQVTFHEIGAADSIADIVGLATLIAALEPASWSTAPLPLGFGRVRTAHGMMPVPTPATALLLEGFATIDDGIGGERVTPTGAAVLRHLRAGSAPIGAPHRLERSGIGFGARSLGGLSNCLRVLAFAPSVAESGPVSETLAVIVFEVDDQTPEDLAIGLAHIRALPAVHDVLQLAGFGKKGRISTQVQVLAAPRALDDVAAACFSETTTIGLRTHLVQRRTLSRASRAVLVDSRSVRVKRVIRPDGPTGKAEADDLATVPGRAARAALRRQAEAPDPDPDPDPEGDAV